jgi:hypothetical protein
MDLKMKAIKNTTLEANMRNLDILNTTTVIDFSSTPAIMCGKALNWRNNDTGRIERMGG